MYNFPILSNGYQVVEYNFNELRLFAMSNCRVDKSAITFKAHRHHDIEFVYVAEGYGNMLIAGKHVKVSAGECIFINSHRMHYGFLDNPNHCVFHIADIHPSIFFNHSDTLKDYISERLSPGDVDYIVLSPKIHWQKAIIDKFLELISEADKNAPNHFQLLAKAYTICADICEHINSIKTDEDALPKNAEILEMMKFIRNNYQNKITIEDIAKVGFVSTSKCNRLFQKITGHSPNVYLTRYRIFKSTELLRDTNLSVTDIALVCGFQTASYYTNVFKQEMNTTPSNYRKDLREKITG